jgi:hypothetical protein
VGVDGNGDLIPMNRRSEKYHRASTGALLNYTSTAFAIIPGTTQNITVPAGQTADVYIIGTCGMLNTNTTAGQYAAVDVVVHVDGAALAIGGWNRTTCVNHGSGNSLTNVSYSARATLGAGAHTIDIRARRVNGNTPVSIGGDAALDTTPAEYVVMVEYR